MRKPDLVVCNFGGGLQTMCMGDMVIAGELPKPDAFIFADTGDEPAYVYKQVSDLRERLNAVGIPLIIVSNGNMHNDLYNGGRFAAMPLFTRQTKEITGFGKTAVFHTKGKLKRQCTDNYKIEPIDKEIRIMLLEMGLAKQTKSGAIRVSKNVLVESWIGYTIDEVERIKPSPNGWQKFRYPLIEKRMYRHDCENWYISRGLPVPLSSACRKCPLIGDKRAIEMRINDPMGHENRLQFDDDLRNGNLRIAATAKGELFLHDSLIPLRNVILEDNRKTLFDCSRGHCMT